MAPSAVRLLRLARAAQGAAVVESPRPSAPFLVGTGPALRLRRIAEAFDAELHPRGFHGKFVPLLDRIMGAVHDFEQKGGHRAAPGEHPLAQFGRKDMLQAARDLRLNLNTRRMSDDELRSHVLANVLEHRMPGVHVTHTAPTGEVFHNGVRVGAPVASSATGIVHATVDEHTGVSRPTLLKRAKLRGIDVGRGKSDEELRAALRLHDAAAGAQPPTLHSADRQQIIDRARDVAQAAVRAERTLNDGGDLGMAKEMLDVEAGNHPAVGAMMAELGKAGQTSPGAIAAIRRIAGTQGLTPIGSAGATVPFDSSAHHLLAGESRAGAAVQVIQPGYTLKLPSGESVVLERAAVGPAPRRIPTRTMPERNEAFLRIVDKGGMPVPDESGPPTRGAEDRLRRKGQILGELRDQGLITARGGKYVTTPKGKRALADAEAHAVESDSHVGEHVTPARGRDLLAGDFHATAARIMADARSDPDYDESRGGADVATGDMVLRSIATEQGYHGATQLATPEEFDRLAKNGTIGQVLYRGNDGGLNKTPAEVHRQLRSGPLRVGTGTFGNGFYMATRRDHAAAYGDKTPESVGRYGLKKDARVITWDDLKKEHDAFVAAHPEATQSDSDESNFLDPGRFAAARGYDAISIRRGQEPGFGAPARGNQYVVLNRTALVSEVPHVAGAEPSVGGGHGERPAHDVGAGADQLGGRAGRRLGSAAAGRAGSPGGNPGAPTAVGDHASTMASLRTAGSRDEAAGLIAKHSKGDLQGLATHAGVPFKASATKATLTSAILDEAGHGDRAHVESDDRSALLDRVNAALSQAVEHRSEDEARQYLEGLGMSTPQMKQLAADLGAVPLKQTKPGYIDAILHLKVSGRLLTASLSPLHADDRSDAVAPHVAGAEQAARERVMKIDEARHAATMLAEADELGHSGASVAALRHRMETRARAGGLPSQMASDLAAEHLRGELPTAIDVYANRYGLTRTTGRAGSTVAYDPAQHQMLGGTRPEHAGKFVTVVRPGYATHVTGEPVLVHKAVVDAPEETAPPPVAKPSRAGRPSSFFRDSPATRHAAGALTAADRAHRQGVDRSTIADELRRQADQMPPASELDEGDFLSRLSLTRDDIRGGRAYDIAQLRAAANKYEHAAAGDVGPKAGEAPAPIAPRAEAQRLNPEATWLAHAADAAQGTDALNAAPVKLGSGYLTGPGRGDTDAYQALARYRGRWFEQINNVLRGTASYPRMDPVFRQSISDIDRVMAKSPLPQSIVVHRGLTDASKVLGPREGWGDLTGKVLSDRGYLSTSASQSKAAWFLDHMPNGQLRQRRSDNVLMRIAVPKGTGALRMSNESRESEVLLEHGLQLEVVADHGDIGGVRHLDVVARRAN